jgi:hypothetical protein
LSCGRLNGAGNFLTLCRNGRQATFSLVSKNHQKPGSPHHRYDPAVAPRGAYAGASVCGAWLAAGNAVLRGAAPRAMDHAGRPTITHTVHTMLGVLVVIVVLACSRMLDTADVTFGPWCSPDQQRQTASLADGAR